MMKFTFALSMFVVLMITGCSKPTETSESQALKAPVSAEKERPEAEKPNVLLIVVDDLGFTDLGSFGSEIETPNLDAIAQAGTRLVNFHTATTCSPTRAMLMTGVDHHLVGLGVMAEPIPMLANVEGKRGYEGYLNDRAATLPEVLQANGYNTYMTGKWHLGKEESQSPAARGFDKSFALLEGGAGHFDDLGLTYPKANYREDGKMASLPDDFYSTEFFTNKMQEYIQQGLASDKPFFAYLAYTAPHWPLQARDESIAHYRGKYDEGFVKLREQRVKAAIEKGVAPENSPRTFDAESWEALSPEEKKVEARKMEIYAAMIHDLDIYIGQLLEFLDASGELDNTVIFFMSDNGAEARLAGSLGGLPEHIAACCNNDFENMGKGDSYLFTGPGWARASVGHSRLYKSTTAQGGILAPAILVYPEMPETNTISKRFVTVKDVMPTILELASIEIPQDRFNGKDILPIEGVSFFSEQDESTVEMGWELFSSKAYRKGKWKVVFVNPLYGEGKWKLHDLEQDPGELVDLSETHPEKFQEMLALYEAYAKDKEIIEVQWRRR